MTATNAEPLLQRERSASELEGIARELRETIIRMTCRAGCGHTGGSLSEIDILTALYFRILRIDPADPRRPDRDRYIQSKGHATPGYYATLAKRGFFDESVLDTFDETGSILQGHPDMHKTPGVDMSTGSLGQGLSAGIGMALGGKWNGLQYWTYVLMGCGEIQEGQIWEAAMFAGARRVERLIAILDYNRVQLTGRMDDVLSVEPLVEKWQAFGWETLTCDGHAMAELVETIERAKEASASGPVIVIARTVKGKGVSFMEDQFAWHGKAPNAEEAERALAEVRRR